MESLLSPRIIVPTPTPQAAANQESSRIRQQALALEQQCTERVHTLEAQLAALERARVADHTAAEQEVVSEERREARLISARFTCCCAAKSLTEYQPLLS